MPTEKEKQVAEQWAASEAAQKRDDLILACAKSGLSASCAQLYLDLAQEGAPAATAFDGILSAAGLLVRAERKFMREAASENKPGNTMARSLRVCKSREELDMRLLDLVKEIQKAFDIDIETTPK